MSTSSVSGAGDDLDPRTDARLSHTTPERVRWLWPGRIPLGKLTVVEGDPAVGKSTLTLVLAARVTTGSGWPDGQPGTGAASVLLLSAEDGLADTIRPRLEAAGADLDRVVAWGKEWDQGDVQWHLRPVVFPTDLSGLERRIHRDRARLVVVDVLVAYLSDRIDSHKDQSVRRLLHHISLAAASTGAAVILIRHHNKAPGAPALYRGGGSIGIVGAARAAYAVVRDPDDGDHRLLSTGKSNLAVEAPTWGYNLVDVPHLGVARLQWDADPDPRSAAELLAGGPSSALGEATTWLTSWRAEHPGAVPAADLLAAAGEAGIAVATLHRARKQLGLQTRKTATGWIVE
jgi:RecA-family ATPase